MECAKEMKGIKTRTFRPTTKIHQYIEERLKQDKNLSPSKIVNDALTAYLSEGEQGNEQFFKYPPNLICPADHTIYLLETLIASCPKCRTRKVCPLWKRTTVRIEKKGE